MESPERSIKDPLERLNAAPQAAKRIRKHVSVYKRRMYRNVKMTTLMEIMLFIDEYNDLFMDSITLWGIRRGGWSYRSVRGALSYMEMMGWISKNPKSWWYRRIYVLPPFKENVERLKKNLDRINAEEDLELGT